METINDKIQNQSGIARNPHDIYETKFTPKTVHYHLISYRTVSVAPKHFMCGICKAIFTNKEECQDHVANLHTEAQKSPSEIEISADDADGKYCKHCRKTFRTSSNLKHHISEVHKKEKPFQCKYCHKRFARNHSRNQHQRLHTGEKPFQCQLCFKSFTHGSYMNNCIKQHHSLFESADEKLLINVDVDLDLISIF